MSRADGEEQSRGPSHTARRPPQGPRRCWQHLSVRTQPAHPESHPGVPARPGEQSLRVGSALPEPHSVQHKPHSVPRAGTGGLSRFCPGCPRFCGLRPPDSGKAPVPQSSGRPHRQRERWAWLCAQGTSAEEAPSTGVHVDRCPPRPGTLPPSRSQALGTKGKGKVAPEGAVLPQTPGQVSSQDCQPQACPHPPLASPGPSQHQAFN